MRQWAFGLDDNMTSRITPPQAFALAGTFAALSNAGRSLGKKVARRNADLGFSNSNFEKRMTNQTLDFV